MIATISRSKSAYFFIAAFVLMSFWWTRIYALGIQEADENYIFGFAYALIALAGGINGLRISLYWGGLSSAVGRGIIFMSLGLLGLWFGQTTWSYYNLILRVEAPYPSIADIGFNSFIPLYALAMISFAKATGAKYKLRKLKTILPLMAIPLLLLLFTYLLLLTQTAIDWAAPLVTILNFASPLGESITISIALITFELSRGVLGGKMKSRMLFLLIAILFQYVTDFTFIYSFNEGTYYNAGPVDALYLLSFTIMSLALVYLRNYE